MTTLILHRVKNIVGFHDEGLIPDTHFYGVHGNLDNGKTDKMRGLHYDNIIVLPGVVIGTESQRVVETVLRHCAKLHTKVTYHESNTMQSMQSA